MLHVFLFQVPFLSIFILFYTYQMNTGATHYIFSCLRLIWSSTITMSTLTTNWNLCFLCQTDIKQPLRSPNTYNRKNVNGFTTLAKNIWSFHSLSALPITINLQRLDNGDEIEKTLISNDAKYHEACRLLFNNTKLNRVLNKSHEAQEEGRKKLESRTLFVLYVIKVTIFPIFLKWRLYHHVTNSKNWQLS